MRGLFSCRTEDWNFLHTVISKFMRDLKSVQAAGDSSGLGRQICWEAIANSAAALPPSISAPKSTSFG
jgi:hypothetical protein